MKVYHYWRSSCSWRVRWALRLLNIPHELVPVDLRTGEQHSEAHLKRNPMGFVPVIQWEDEAQKKQTLSDSIAILRFLDQTHSPSTFGIFPKSPQVEANVNELVGIIASGTQPVANLGVMKFHSKDPSEQKKWAQHWIDKGLSAYERSLEGVAGTFSVGDQLTAADLCLIPQCYNATRFGLDLNAYPKIQTINANCLKTEACQLSAPENYKPKDFE